MNTVKTLIASTLIAVAAVPAFAQSYSHLDPITPSQKSRAEVLADLEIYRESGLALVDRTEDMSENTARRQQAQARYDQLRQSPAYAALVQKFADKEARKNATTTAAAR